MTANKPFDPLLARQLKRLSLPPELEQSPEWEKFVASVNEHYLHMADDRALLSRSIELQTQEMEELRRRFESQRSSLVAVINAALAGVVVGLVANAAGTGSELSLLIGAVVTGALVVSLVNTSKRLIERGRRSLEPRFAREVETAPRHG